MPKYKGTYKKGNSKRGYRWYWYIDYKGKRIYSKGGFDTAEEASGDRTLKKNQLASGTFVQAHKVTVKKFVIQYLKEYAMSSMRKPSRINVESIARNNIVPHIGDIMLQDLRPFHIEQLKNKLLKEKTQYTAYNVLVTLRKILNKAVKWDFIQVNPVSKIDLPKRPKTEHPILSPKELFDLVENLEGYSKYVVALAGYTALRRSEIFGLMWKDINFKNNTINIERQFHHQETYPVKSDHSKEIIPIWHRLSRMLKEWKLQCNFNIWLFPGKNDKPLAPESWSTRGWPRIREKYNFPSNLRFHDLRHTFASIMIAQGVSVPDVQKLMRHSSYQTTMDIYRHILPNQLEKAIQALECLYVEINVEKESN